jgi:hypothetical protein
VNHSHGKLLAAPSDTSFYGDTMSDPVFILCGARSGSTLLRLLLDTHQDIACPPEMNLAPLCGQLSLIWSLIEGESSARTPGNTAAVLAEQALVPEAAIRGVRETTNFMLGQYLSKRGRRTFCDKSLGTAKFADLLIRIFPGAKFICLHRYPMDFIKSAVEACPWGLSGYGFDPYISTSPSNSISALARYWLDETAAICRVAEAYPKQSFRVRYEDLVDAPEMVMNSVFSFLGLPPEPGISGRCFSSEHERNGPSDFKIWWTSEIKSNSVGRGEGIPAGLIPMQAVEAMNALLDQLEYLRIDESRVTPGMSPDPRLPETAPPSERQANLPEKDCIAEPQSRLLDSRITAAIAEVDDIFRRQWESCSQERLALVTRSPASGSECWWVIDLAHGTVRVGLDSLDELDWCLVGPAATWEAVLGSGADLSVAMRHGDLRYSAPSTADSQLIEHRMKMISHFLGIM